MREGTNMFYNRETELQRLNEYNQQNRAQLLIVYGRRRVGKTELLKQFARGKDFIYFLADLSSDRDQLQEFSERIRLFTGDESLIENPFANWNALFAYLKNLASKQRLIVIIDEYQYLQSSNHAISSMIQKAWDEGLKDSAIFLVLCGSYISFIENELLGYKSPLYGRRTAQFFIEPMSFFEAIAFFDSYSIIDKIRAYGILGGIPAYLLQFDPARSVEKNIESAFLYKDGFLYNETRLLLMEELREPKNYFAILKTIAFGATRLNEIVQKSGLDRGVVVKYLDVLQNLRIIQREVPVTERNPDKSRKGIYRIQDQYFQFWFRFIMPNQSFIEEGRRDFVLQQRINPWLDQFLGAAFEQVGIDFLKRINGQDRLPFQFDRVGRYWQGETEIDVVAFDMNNEQALLAECKWSTKPIGSNILDDLVKKAAVIQDEMNFKQVYYAIFSRSGFTDALKKSQRSDLLLFHLDDLMI